MGNRTAGKNIWRPPHTARRKRCGKEGELCPTERSLLRGRARQWTVSVGLRFRGAACTCIGPFCIAHRCTCSCTVALCGTTSFLRRRLGCVEPNPRSQRYGRWGGPLRGAAEDYSIPGEPSMLMRSSPPEVEGAFRKDLSEMHERLHKALQWKPLAEKVVLFMFQQYSSCVCWAACDTFPGVVARHSRSSQPPRCSWTI